ncbi:probable protein MUS-26, involved in DNA repair [Claviceps purpurea 20.1]|uniref:Probable protein MUS-26, involved in DNA repair n=1 Tax=Claviceps purpurea (strain 20.1) TaxID=1111077 RepID=M1WFV9_CLAP2|nr:probable protein MUS-26, involved in DNA repair [Claviceps purpurea 20.1]
MSAALPDVTSSSSSLLHPSQASFLLSSFSNFLTVAVHSILYHRALYPPESFLVARAYNLPVRQSRHPGVCTWVRDAVAATAQQIRQGTARQICLAVHEPRRLDVLERWIFDVQSFPDSSWGGAEGGPDWPAGGAPPGADLEVLRNLVNREAGPEDDMVNPADVHEALRGALSRLSHAAQGRGALPEGCTFTLGVELRDEAVAPIRTSFPAPAIYKPELGRARAGTATTPIRSVQAGPLFFECWVEQARMDETASTTAAVLLEEAPEMPLTFPSTFESSTGGDATTTTP